MPEAHFAIIHPDGNTELGHCPHPEHIETQVAERIATASHLPTARRPHRYSIPDQSLRCLGIDDSSLPTNPHARTLLRRIAPTLADHEWRGPVAITATEHDHRAVALPAWVHVLLELGVGHLAAIDTHTDQQLADVDPIRLSTYLATRGWRHVGFLSDAGARVRWASPAPIALTLTYSLLAGAFHGSSRAGALGQLAGLERRDREDVRAEMYAQDLNPPRQGSTRRHRGPTAEELRLRAEFAKYHHLLRDPDPARKAEAERLRQARRVPSSDAYDPLTWRHLEETVAAWQEDPVALRSLFGVLTAHPVCVSPIRWRHHEQARTLTEQSDPTAAVDQIPEAVLNAAPIRTLTTGKNYEHDPAPVSSAEHPADPTAVL